MSFSARNVVIPLLVLSLGFFVISGFRLIHRKIWMPWEEISISSDSFSVTKERVRRQGGKPIGWRLCFNYSFNVGERIYHGRDCNVFGRFRDRFEAKSQIDVIKSNSNFTIRVYYDKRDPSHSIVSNGRRDRQEAFLLIGSLAVFLTCSAALVLQRNKS